MARALIVVAMPTAHAFGVALERWEREKDRKREKQVNRGASWSELEEVGRRRERDGE